MASQTPDAKDSPGHTSGSPTTKRREDSTRPDDGTSPNDASLTGFSLALLVFALGLAQWIMGMDLTILATATPTISSYFNALQDVSWYGGSYFIAISALTPLFGRLYQDFSPRWVFTISNALFFIGSLVGALAPSSNTVIGSRVIMGVGASGVLNGTSSIVGLFIPKQKQPALFGLIQGAYVISEAMGPLIGGALTTGVTWRWCFWINLPLSGVAGLIFFLVIPRSSGLNATKETIVERLRRLDFLGFVLFVGAAVMLLLALQFGGVVYAWDSSVIIGLFCGSGVTAICLSAWQWRQQDKALIPPSVFLQRSVATGFCVAIFGQGSFQLMVYYLPIWFQAIKGASAFSSGVMFLPTAISDLVTALVGGALSMVSLGREQDKSRLTDVTVTTLPYYNPFLLSGAGLFVIGAGLCTTFQADTYEGKWIGYQILIGVGSAFILAVPIVAMQRVLPRTKVAIGSGIIILGGTLGGSVFLAIAQAVSQHSLRSGLRSSSVDGQTIERILAAGALGFRQFVAGGTLESVVDGYNYAVTRTYFVSVAGCLVAWLAAWGLEWTKLSHVLPASEHGEGGSVQKEAGEEIKT